MTRFIIRKCIDIRLYFLYKKINNARGELDKVKKEMSYGHYNKGYQSAEIGLAKERLDTLCKKMGQLEKMYNMF